MTDDELIAQLCLRAGMTMEDICGEAVLAQASDRESLLVALARLEEASGRIAALLNAARTIINGN